MREFNVNCRRLSSVQVSLKGDLGFHVKSCRQPEEDNVLLSKDNVQECIDEVEISSVDSSSERVPIGKVTVRDTRKTVSPGDRVEDTVSIPILFTNDMHGKYKPTSSGLGGLPYLAELIKELRRRFPDALLVDVGDIAYNPPYSTRHHFEPMISAMNVMKYDVMALGNHEYQYGTKSLVKELVRKAKFPVINSNLIYRETGNLPEGVKPYVIIERNGIKIAFIGVCTTRLATSAHPHVGEDLIKHEISWALKRYIPEVKEKGADIVVVLAHEGVRKILSILSSIPQIANQIDVVYAGHDHYLTTQPAELQLSRDELIEFMVKSSKPFKVHRFLIETRTSHTVYVVEAGAYTKYLGFSVLKVDKRTRKLVKFSMRPIPVRSHELSPDPQVLKVIEEYQQSHPYKVSTV